MYNNINFKDIKYNKVVSYKVIIYSITTIAVILYLELPISSLN